MNKINKLLFAPWVNRSIKVNLIDGLSVSLPNVQEHTTTGYTPVGKTAKIRNQVLSAVMKVCMLVTSEDGSHGGYGCYSLPDGTFGSVLQIPYGSEQQIAYLENSQIRAIRKVGEEYQTYVLKEGHQDGVLLLTLLLLDEMSGVNDELKQSIDNCIDCLSGGLDKADNSQRFADNVAIISDNLYYRLCTYDQIGIRLLDETGNVKKITSLNLNSAKFDNINNVFGKITFNNNHIAEKEVTIDDLKLNRVLSDTEKKMVPVLDEHYIMPKEALEIANLIKNSSNFYLPKRNFMLRGESSSGKTSMVKAIASLLGLPYVFITCSADTESYDFLGQFIPEASGEENTKSGFKYQPTDFIEGIKNGWVVEVQEPYTIAKQGVLTALNGLLDDCAGIRLKDGTYIKRHPDAIVVFTTNVSYVGCKKPNQSVLRRMHGVYDINTPDNSIIKERVKALTGFKDDIVLDKMIYCANAVNSKLKEEYVDDGVCGVSEIVDWVENALILGNIVSAAKSTIVSKATDDLELQAAISAIIEAKFEDKDDIDTTGFTTLKF